MEAEAKELITGTLDMSEDARAKLRKAGILEADGKGKKSSDETKKKRQRTTNRRGKSTMTLSSVSKNSTMKKRR
ncbi:MAG: hypothetical protein ACLR8Y_01985 [Alistipes indistinctus]